MRRLSDTAPDADRSAESALIAAVCAACGIQLDSLLHQGEIVAVYRGWPGKARDAAAGAAPNDALRCAAAAAPVAVKVTRARWRGHPGAVELLAREHRALRAVEHPRIVRAQGFAAVDGAAALVTEYLPGGDLVPLAGSPLRCWLSAAVDVASALAAVHAAGLVHGDVKARNVLFDASGRAKLIDLGSARPIGAPLGPGGHTPAHTPLRFDLTHAAPAADVYAFAVLLYELLSGRLPFGPSPTRWRAPPPLDTHPAGVPLARRVHDSLEAATLRDVGTLIEFADVLESVHGKVAQLG